MGYDLQISRKNNWADDEESHITLGEWLDYIKGDNELKLTNGYETKIPGLATPWIESPGFCEWSAHPNGDNYVWFDYGHGSISTKNPDDVTILKMMEIAEFLNARVQGDDGEFYDESYFKPKDESVAANRTASKNKKPWWKIW
jgi:hypothetical protein